MKTQLIVILIGALALSACGIKDDPLPVGQSSD
jgi:hypothetical protein